MSDPQKPDQGNDFDDMLRGLDREFGARRQEDDDPVSSGRQIQSLVPQQQGQQPASGEARPIPQQSARLRLPLYQPGAFMVLLIINVIIFAVPAVMDVLGVRIQGLPASQFFQALGAKNNEAIYVGHQYYRFLTAMFLHGNLLHIAFNGFALYSLGMETERIYGTLRFLALYFIAGLAGGVASYALSINDSVGASGAIFGLVGGLAAFYYLSRKLLGQIARQQLGSLITVIMINLFLGFSSPNIDNFAHIGGLIGGAAVGLLIAPRLELDNRLYPPEIVRRHFAPGWVGALGLAVILIGLAVVIKPPL